MEWLDSAERCARLATELPGYPIETNALRFAFKTKRLGTAGSEDASALAFQAFDYFKVSKPKKSIRLYKQKTERIKKLNACRSSTGKSDRPLLI